MKDELDIIKILKNRKLWVCVVLFFILIITIVQIPFWIGDFITLFTVDYDTSDILSFAGDYLTLIGTIIFGYVTIHLSKQANTINLRLLSLEEKKNVPYVDISLISEDNIISENQISINITLENRTDSVIEILGIPKLYIRQFIFNNKTTIPFAEGWVKKPQIFPNEKKEFNFFIEKSKSDIHYEELINQALFLIGCGYKGNEIHHKLFYIDLEFQIKNIKSEEKYIEKLELVVGPDEMYKTFKFTVDEKSIEKFND